MLGWMQRGLSIHCPLSSSVKSPGLLFSLATQKLLSLKLGEQIFFFHRSSWQVDFTAILWYPDNCLGYTESATSVPSCAVSLWGRESLDQAVHFVSFWFNPFLSCVPSLCFFCLLVHITLHITSFFYILGKIAFEWTWTCHGLKRKSISLPAGWAGSLAVCAIASAATCATHLRRKPSAPVW